MTYGFRLFSLSVAKNLTGWKPIEVTRTGDDHDDHYVDHLDEVLDTLEDLGTLTGMPRLRAAEAGGEVEPISEYQEDHAVRGDPRIRFADHEASGNNMLFTAWYGNVGTHPIAMGVDPDDDDDILGKSPGHPYRCAVLLPQSGTKGVLAVESIDKSHPSPVVVSWLARGSHQRAQLMGGDTDVWRPVVRAVRDLPRLRQMIMHAEDAKVRLTKKIVSGSGRRGRRKLLVEFAITTRTERDDVFQWARHYLGMADDGLQGNGIVELAEVVDDSMAGLGFTDGSIVVTDPEGTKKIGPNHLDEIFEYPVAEDIRPDDDEWLWEVKDVVAGMQTYLEVDLDLD